MTLSRWYLKNNSFRVSPEFLSKSQIVRSRSKKICLYGFKVARLLVTKDNGFIFEHMEFIYLAIGIISGGGLVYLLFRNRLAGRQQYLEEKVRGLQEESADHEQQKNDREQEMIRLTRDLAVATTDHKNLKEKLGVTSQMKILRFNIKKIAETNHLPEYNISMEDDVVMFTRKEPPKENNTPVQFPKHVSKKEIEKHARPGESYDQVTEQINKLKETLR